MPFTVMAGPVPAIHVLNPARSEDVDARVKSGHDERESVENMQDLMKGKRGLIMGVANDHSIAWGIAKALAAQGAELALTYQNDALGKRVAPLAEELGAADHVYR